MRALRHPVLPCRPTAPFADARAILKPRFAIEATNLSDARSTGVGRYARSLVEALSALQLEDSEEFELVQMFKDDCKRLVGEIQQAAAAGDWKRLERLAHNLKGSSGMLSARPLSAAAGALERNARERDVDGLRASLDALSAEAARLLAELEIVARPVSH